jgi:N-terminal domain of anti-restriction factor ArdC
MNNEKTQAVLDGIEASIARLADETDAYRQSEQWKNVLRTMSHFHTYSFANQMAILFQRPNARRVAGFNTWKTLGRHVVKGSTGIAILAPILVKPKRKKEGIQTEEVGETKDDKRSLFFRVVYVFDYADTEGADLPGFSLNEVSEDYGMFPLAQAAVESLGIQVTLKPISDPGMSGYCEGGRITIKETLLAGEKTATLIHEAAHALLHWGDQKEIADALGKKMREVEAESTAYAVMQYLGIDSTADEYLTLYGVNGKTIKASLGRIRCAVSTLIDAIEKQNGLSNQSNQVEEGETLALAA